MTGSATTVAAYIRAIGHVIPRIGGIALRDLKPMHFNQLYVELRESGRRVRYGEEAGQRRPLAPATVRRVHMLLSKALNDAIDEGMLNANPARRAKPPREIRNCDLNVWSADELALFLSSVREDVLYSIWRLAAATGMRRGEVVGLQWGDIDFVANTILVRLTRTTVGRTIITKSPKNGRARVLSVDPGTLAALADLRRPWTRSDDFVVVDSDGEPLHPDRISQLFRKLVRYSGLRPIRFHDLRHTQRPYLLGPAYQ